jgi:hypothetical protein
MCKKNDHHEHHDHKGVHSLFLLRFLQHPFKTYNLDILSCTLAKAVGHRNILVIGITNAALWLQFSVVMPPLAGKLTAHTYHGVESSMVFSTSHLLHSRKAPKMLDSPKQLVIT